MRTQKRLTARAVALPNPATSSATVVVEIVCGLGLECQPKTHYHVLLDASGSMYHSRLHKREIAQFVEMALQRNELEPIVSDGERLWTVTGETRLRMALANDTPMRLAVGAMLVAIEGLPEECDLSVVAFADKAQLLFESVRSDQWRGALELLAHRGLLDAVGDGSRLASAVEECWSRVLDHGGTEAIRHKALVVSDGGIHDGPETVRALGRLMATGTTVSAVAMGEPTHHGALRQIADSGGGFYQSLDRTSDLAHALLADHETDRSLVADRLEGLLLLRKDLCLGGALEVDPVTRFLAPRKTPSDRILIPLGPARQRETRLVVFALNSRNRSAIDNGTAVASLTLRATSPGVEPSETALDIFVDDGTSSFSQEARRCIVRAQCYVLQRTADEAKKAGDYARAERSLVHAARLLESLQQKQLAEAVLLEARAMAAAARSEGSHTVVVPGRDPWAQ